MMPLLKKQPKFVGLSGWLSRRSLGSDADRSFGQSVWVGLLAVLSLAVLQGRCTGQTPVFVASTPFGPDTVNAFSSVRNFDGSVTDDTEADTGPTTASITSAAEGVPFIRWISMVDWVAAVTVDADATVHSEVDGSSPPSGSANTPEAVEIIGEHMHTDTVNADPNGPYGFNNDPFMGSETKIGDFEDPLVFTWETAGWDQVNGLTFPSPAGTLKEEFHVTVTPPGDGRFGQTPGLYIETTDTVVTVNVGSVGLQIYDKDTATVLYEDQSFGNTGAVSDYAFVRYLPIPAVETVKYASGLQSGPGGGGGVNASPDAPIFNNEIANGQSYLDYTVALTVSTQ